jgi:hypothetical protein
MNYGAALVPVRFARAIAEHLLAHNGCSGSVNAFSATALSWIQFGGHPTQATELAPHCAPVKAPVLCPVNVPARTTSLHDG